MLFSITVFKEADDVVTSSPFNKFDVVNYSKMKLSCDRILVV